MTAYVASICFVYRTRSNVYVQEYHNHQHWCASRAFKNVLHCLMPNMTSTTLQKLEELDMEINIHTHIRLQNLRFDLPGSYKYIPQITTNYGKCTIIYMV